MSWCAAVYGCFTRWSMHEFFQHGWVSGSYRRVSWMQKTKSRADGVPSKPDSQSHPHHRPRSEGEGENWRGYRQPPLLRSSTQLSTQIGWAAGVSTHSGHRLPRSQVRLYKFQASELLPLQYVILKGEGTKTHQKRPQYFGPL